MFEHADQRWEERLQDLKIFVLEHSRWPKTYWPPKATPRGPIKESEHRLAQWVSLQRNRKKNPGTKRPLGENLIAKLNLLGIKWEIRNKTKRKKEKEPSTAATATTVVSNANAVSNTGSNVGASTSTSSAGNVSTAPPLQLLPEPHTRTDATDVICDSGDKNIVSVNHAGSETVPIDPTVFNSYAAINLLSSADSSADPSELLNAELLNITPAIASHSAFDACGTLSTTKV